MTGVQTCALPISDHWVDTLNERGVPSGAILSLEAALKQAQIQHRETIRAVRDDDLGELKLFNMTAKFEKSPGDVVSPPPRLGAHTEEYLIELGFTKDRIRELREKAVV